MFICKNCFQIGNFNLQLSVFVLQLLTFQTCQRTQTHIYNGLGLGIGETEAVNQFFLGRLYILGTTDNLDNLINIVKGNQQAF